MAPTSKKCMIVDNQKNQEKEIKLILQLLNAIKAKHTLSVQEAEEGGCFQTGGREVGTSL